MLKLAMVILPNVTISQNKDLPIWQIRLIIGGVGRPDSEDKYYRFPRWREYLLALSE